LIPISCVEFGPAVEERVLQVLRSGMVAQGPVVKEFEDTFAAITGVKHAVAVNSGTTALVAAMEALDLKPGDEVITSPFTFVATLNAILEAGATAVFADIREDDFCLDPASVESKITDRTKVLMPVHLYGQCADMDGLMPIVEKHQLALVEDAAQAHAAGYGDKKAGSFGLGCFSFYGTKNVTTGEGGMITTDDDDVADRLRMLRNQGMKARYQYEMAGHNYRLTDLQAALALPQLARLDDMMAKRRANADRLSKGLAGVPGLAVPRQMSGRSHVWHQYTVLVTDEAKVDRDTVVAELGKREIGSGIYYPKLVFDYDCYRDNDAVRTSAAPVAERVVRQAMSLPVHPKLSGADLDAVIAAVREILGA